MDLSGHREADLRCPAVTWHGGSLGYRDAGNGPSQKTPASPLFQHSQVVNVLCGRSFVGVFSTLLLVFDVGMPSGENLRLQSRGEVSACAPCRELQAQAGARN